MPRARSTAPSIALFPFMSILVCLIGTIVVLICVLSIIQATHMGGRPKAEVQLALEFVTAQNKIKQLQMKLDEVQDGMTGGKEARKQRDELEQQITKLNLQLESARDSEKFNRELQRELELAIIQLDTMSKEKPPIVGEVEQLRKELAAREIDPKELVPEIIIQPGGSGVAQGSNLYFVEATGGALTLYRSKTDTARVTAGSIGADKEYNAFLEKVVGTPNVILIFLIRDDGWYSYVLGAGWAESSYKIKTAKLPIPGKGAIEFGQFEGLMAK